MDRVAEHTTNKQKMDEYSMVYYNNLLVGDDGGSQLIASQSSYGYLMF